jgi:hypothetical protein
MNAILPLLPSAPARAGSLRDRIARTPVLIFHVDGTLAETESVHRCAFNAAFREAGIAWYWDVRTYKRLLQVTGGKERIRAFARSRPPVSFYPTTASPVCTGARPRTIQG